MGSGPGLLSFINIEWLKKLPKQLKQFTDERAEELGRLGDEFTDPVDLARFYVEPCLQAYRPLPPHHGLITLDPCQPSFSLLNSFFASGPAKQRDGSHLLFILGEPGSGKTALLVMIRLLQLAKLWPRGYGCELVKLDEQSLDYIETLGNRARTVLLFDALNEDSQARGRLLGRLLPLLRAGEPFYRVIITCRSHFFPEVSPDSTGRLRIRALSGYNCPILYLAPFAAHQVEQVVQKRLALNTENCIGFKRFGVERQRKRAVRVLNSLGELSGRPLVLQHVHILLKTEEHRLRDAYTIYEALIQYWLERQIDALNKSGCRCLPKRFELFNGYVRLARWMEEQGTGEIGLREIRELFCEKAEICPLPHCSPQADFLCFTSRQTYRFAHMSFREFLLAYALIYDNRPFPEPPRATDQIVRFLDLAHGIADYVSSLNLVEFNPFRYAETYRTMFSWQDRLGRLRNRVLKGPEMVMLPGGRFKMGDIHGGGSGDARPVHEVELSDFALSRYPVTFEEYDLYCVATGSRKPSDNGWGRGRRPVVDVSWQDANHYCEWLSMVTGRPYRLPTEAEWEYGCRAGTETIYFFGNDGHLLPEYAWYAENARNMTHPVGEKKANAWGLHDLYGNIWEWCADSYKKDYYTELPMSNPSGAEHGGAGRVLRGGSWDSGERFIRSSFRFRLSSGLRIIRVGFRVAQGYQE